MRRVHFILVGLGSAGCATTPTVASEGSSTVAPTVRPTQAPSDGARWRRTTGGGGRVVAYYDPDDYGVPQAVLDAWLESAVTNVEAYFGPISVPLTRIYLQPVPAASVTFGKKRGGKKPRIDVYVGYWAAEEDFRSDWVLTHELIHVAFPSPPKHLRWVSEGLATWAEPFARVRTGHLTPERAWRRVARGLPNGQPRPGDRGLDRTPTWGRTYWGGALFFLLADVGLLEASGGCHRLEDAVKAVVAAGGDGRWLWKPRRMFETADEALETGVLTRLYDRHRETPVPVDLPRLLRALGVEDDGHTLTLHDDAPLAWIRRRIEGRAGGCHSPDEVARQ